MPRPDLRRRHWLAATTLGLALPSRAQTFPSRAFRIVVPWAPGGLVDTAARTVGEVLFKAFGQAAAVENVPGAAGTLGADLVVKAPADGSVLLMATSSIAIDVAGARKTPYQPARDLVPVALVADTDSLVVVPVASPIRSLRELVAAAKARPGELNFGTPGIGSPAHLFAEYLAQSAGVKLTHVPYGRTAAINDLIGGRLDFMVATTPSSLPQVKNGQLRALAVTGSRRSPALPDVPTVAEAGLAGYEASQWVALFAPAATPAETVRRLNAEVSKGLEAPETANLLQQRGLAVRTTTPDGLAKVVAAETEKWRRVMQASGIRLE